MKDRMLTWVEEHKGENPDGTWFVMGLDWLGEQQFPTEEALDEFLWNEIVSTPDHLWSSYL
mgnify:CR=1 FL=1